jgi:hypothetical protein
VVLVANNTMNYTRSTDNCLSFALHTSLFVDKATSKEGAVPLPSCWACVCLVIYRNIVRYAQDMDMPFGQEEDSNRMTN